jgi:hypothetical protein
LVIESVKSLPKQRPFAAPSFYTGFVGIRAFSSRNNAYAQKFHRKWHSRATTPHYLGWLLVSQRMGAEIPQHRFGTLRRYED